MRTSVPRVKMKLAVHWAPSVNICTPGWMVAVAAGAHPPAGGAAVAVGVGTTVAMSVPAIEDRHSAEPTNEMRSHEVLPPDCRARRRHGSPGSGRSPARTAGFGQVTAARTWARTASTSAGSTSNRSGRSNRSARRVGQLGPDAGGPLHGVGELGRVGGGERDHGRRRRPGRRGRRAMPTAVCGSTSIPVASCTWRITVERLRRRRARRPGSDRRAGPRRHRAPEAIEELGGAAAVAAVELEEQPLVVRRHLDVHRRAVGGHHRLGDQRAVGDPAGEDVVAVRADHQLVDRQTHPLGDPPGEDVAEVAGGHRERAAPEPGDGGDVVDDLRHHPRPVDRVHRRQAHRGHGTRCRRRAPSRGPGSRRRCPRPRRCARWARRPWSSGGAARRSPGRTGGARRCRGCRGPRTLRWRRSPVSPEVATTMVARWLRAASSWSNSRPTSCSATSLKASVGPQKSSRRWRSPTSTTGQTSGWSNAA